MKDEILSAVRPFVFMNTLAKVSGMLDQYREQLKAKAENSDSDLILLKDQLNHLLRALTMISEVPETVDGSKMAKGIAGEALSTLR